MNAYLNIVSMVVTVISIVMACNMDMSNPWLFAFVFVIFGSAMACIGYTFRESKDKFDTYAETLTQKAARKAVNDKMPEIKEAIDDAIAEAIDNIDIDKLSRELEKKERYDQRMKGIHP